jgi:hypothetical protein
LSADRGEGLQTSFWCRLLRRVAFEKLLKVTAYVARTLRCPNIPEGLIVYDRVKEKVICANRTHKREVENDYLKIIL